MVRRLGDFLRSEKKNSVTINHWFVCVVTKVGCTMKLRVTWKKKSDLGWLLQPSNQVYTFLVDRPSYEGLPGSFK